MSTLFCGVILLFSSLVAILAIDFHGNRNNVNFDTDWFWMGSDSIAIGKMQEKGIIIKIMICLFNVLLRM